jgi:hypothetical protein
VAQGSDAISASETRSSALEVVGRLGSTGGAPPEAWRPSGSGKQAGEDGRGETDCEMGKAGEGGKFLERKTRTSPTEETCGLDQSDGSEKGPLIDRQGVQAEELGDCLGTRHRSYLSRDIPLL